MAPSLVSSTLLRTLVVLLAAACCPSACHSWGTTGHEIVANVAWRRLSNEARAWVVQVLNATMENSTVNNVRDDEDPGSPLGAVADWADRVRHFLPWSAALHYIDVRDDLFSDGCHMDPHLNPSCRFDYDRDCPNNTCVAGAIVNYTHQLLQRVDDLSQDDSSTSKQPAQPQLRGSGSLNDSPFSDQVSSIPKTKEALMFLTHFIGDIHQPLHCSRTTDKGGNDFHVHFTPTTLQTTFSSHHHAWNLHSVWDTGLIDVALARNYNHSRSLLEQALWEELVLLDDGGGVPSSTARDYLECDKALGANQTCTAQWGQESWDLAIRYAYTLDDNRTDVTDGSTLDEDYYLTRWPLAKERLLAGAVRLAGTLEWVFNNKNKDDLENKDEGALMDQYSTSSLVQAAMGPSLQNPSSSSWMESILSWWFSSNGHAMFEASS